MKTKKEEHEIVLKRGQKTSNKISNYAFTL